MDDSEKRRLITEAFSLGFMCSREGFNGECAYEHCCDGLQPHWQIEEEFQQDMVKNEAFQQCLEKALERLGKG